MRRSTLPPPSLDSYGRAGQIQADERLRKLKRERFRIWLSKQRPMHLFRNKTQVCVVAIRDAEEAIFRRYEIYKNKFIVNLINDYNFNIIFNY